MHNYSAPETIGRHDRFWHHSAVSRTAKAKADIMTSTFIIEFAELLDEMASANRAETEVTSD